MGPPFLYVGQGIPTPKERASAREKTGYSIRATPVDNDGVTLPTYDCYVAFITEDARTAALT
jgi:hypothetical protein